MKKIRQITITRAENGWMVVAGYQEDGSFPENKTWIETTAEAASARALRLMTEDPEPTPSAPTAE